MFQIPILHEDENVLVVNKPAGLVVHSDGRTNEPTLVDWLVKKYPEIADVGERVRAGLPATQAKLCEALRAGIVHRLDRDTSGVIIIAKNQK
jgi:23S rRNA pseudouridine1911/1915/1917 synthase